MSGKLERGVYEPGVGIVYQSCVFDRRGRCKRWSHDHSNDEKYRDGFGGTALNFNPNAHAFGELPPEAPVPAVEGKL